MPTGSFSSMNCAIAQTLEQIGERWTLLIVRNAFCGMTRFDHFQDHLGIATNVLAARLRKLAQIAIMERVRSDDDGRSHEYRLTKKGLALYPVLIAITDWGERWARHPRGPRIVLRDRDSGRPVPRVTVRSADGRSLGPFDVVARPGPGADDKIRELLAGAWSSGARSTMQRRRRRSA